MSEVFMKVESCKCGSKCKSKVKGKFVKVDVDLSTETIVKLALDAHELDITLNEYANIILADYVAKMKKETEKK